MRIALLALPLLFACSAESEPAPPPSPAPASETTPAVTTPAPGSEVADSKRVDADEEPVTQPTLPVLEKRDLRDVSPQAICEARAKEASLGTFSADAAFGIESPIDVSARVILHKSAAGDLYNSLDLNFIYPDKMTDGVRFVATGVWIITVKNPKDGVDSIVPGDVVDVTVVDMGKLDTRCTTEPGGGALSHEGPGDAGKLVVTERTATSVEGTLERTLPDGTVAKLAFRAPIVDPSAPSTLDTTCCMQR